MSCAAVDCTNRPSPGSSISFHRFPLGDKDRLHRWMANMRRHNFKPSPYSRICSHHFEDSCFYKNNKGQVCLAKTAVPTKFSSLTPLRWHGPNYIKGGRNMENYENHEFHTYSLKSDSKRKFVEEEVVLDEFVKEEDASDPDMDESSGTPVIYPTEICVTAVRHDHCYRSWSSDSMAEKQEIESAKKLKHNLNLVLGKMEACRKKIKLKNATIKRLKRKVTSLSSVISELKAKNLIETKKI
ncbi:THAP domain-containing protein isoform X2 [Megalobrama amblycephala]|nr:THAP domain-containing protein isoform X2 [Megalobrama amblycephala]